MMIDAPQCKTHVQYVDRQVTVPTIISGNPVFFQANDGTFVNLATLQQIYVYHGLKGYYWVYGRDMAKNEILLSDGFDDYDSAQAWLILLMSKLGKSDSQ